MKNYNFCPYCGKNLPSGADYCPSCESHIVRPEAAPAEQPAVSATQAETGGVISGTVTDAQGHPLRNVEVHAQTPAEIAGRPLARYVAQSDEQGTYSMEVSSYPYRLSAYIKVLYRGKQWQRQLHPTDDSADIVTPKGHISKDFRWQLSGLVPGQEPDSYSSYYGGYIQVRWGIAITTFNPRSPSSSSRSLQAVPS